jgi:hypothetical protein
MINKILQGPDCFEHIFFNTLFKEIPIGPLVWDGNNEKLLHRRRVAFLSDKSGLTALTMKYKNSEGFSITHSD